LRAVQPAPRSPLAPGRSVDSRFVRSYIDRRAAGRRPVPAVA